MMVEEGGVKEEEIINKKKILFLFVQIFRNKKSNWK